MSYARLKTEVRDNVAILTLNDPSTLNAAGMELMADLKDAVAKVACGDLACRAVILTGEGRGFCSGANLAGRNLYDGPPLDPLGDVYNPFIRSLRDLPVPLVTAVNGPAAGIGCSFALMGDMIIAGESGYFLQAFRRIGLVPDGGSTWLSPRAVGKARAMELALLGDKLPAAKALEWGLINRVVPDVELMDEAFKLADQLARGPASLSMIRQLIWAGMESSFDEALEAERAAQARAHATADAREGVTAFLEKRPAVFTGK